MNKQALVFISLFSMILMLSIYYVTSPIKPLDDQKVVSEGTLTTLQAKLDEKRLTIRSEQSTILATSTSSEKDKQVALTVLQSLDASVILEETVKTTLIGLGFMNAFIEVEGKQMKIIVESSAETMEDAARVLAAAMDCGDNRYAVEVSFQLSNQ